MKHPYQKFVRDLDKILGKGEKLPCGGFKAGKPIVAKAKAPRVLILAPHPDDECLTGALPLRLQREAGWRVAVVPVTLGSRADRRLARLKELNAACRFLSWDVLAPGAEGLPDLMRREAPSLVLMPHAKDANSTHRKVHQIGLRAIRSLGREARTLVAETEYWSTMENPNLMVETNRGDTADLVASLSCHRGEVGRNPYHVLLSCWLADGARRGAELVGGQGAKATQIRFATLYRLSRWNGRALARASGPGRVCAAHADIAKAL